jgi:pimeloyl-ACP methyl ester carboxylesterase
MFFSFGSSKIYYSDSGKGTPIVLLHGYLESSEVWNGFGEKLAAKFRVISVDLPGHGLSDICGEADTMEFMGKVIKELLGSLSIKRVFMTGHSLGGYVALAFLEFFPDSLSGYCLFHSHPLSDTPETIGKRMLEITMVHAGKKELVYSGNVIRMFANSNLERFSDALRRSKEIASQIQGEGIIAVLNGMMARPSRLSVMEEGRVPCLWILGAMDNYIPCDIIQARVNLPYNARVVVLTNSGHMGFIEEEDKAVQVITEFIATKSTAAD